MSSPNDPERPVWQKSWRDRQRERGLFYLTMWVPTEDVAAIRAYAAKRQRAKKRTQTLEATR